MFEERRKVQGARRKKRKRTIVGQLAESSFGALGVINRLTIVFTPSFRRRPESPAKAGLQRDFWMPDRVRYDEDVGTISRQLIRIGVYE